MTPRQALPILRVLADGIDPHTGEKFPPGSAYQHPDTVRALFVAIEVLDSAELRAAQRAELPSQTGKAWSAEEDARLRDGFAAKRSAAELAAAHNRTLGAIRARLMRLGLIAAQDTYA